MDLFSTCLSKQLPTFFSWSPNLEATGTDALVQDWQQLQNIYTSSMVPHRTGSSKGTVTRNHQSPACFGVVQSNLVCNSVGSASGTPDTVPQGPLTILSSLNCSLPMQDNPPSLPHEWYPATALFKRNFRTACGAHALLLQLVFQHKYQLQLSTVKVDKLV